MRARIPTARKPRSSTEQQRGTPLRTRFDIGTWDCPRALPAIRHALDNRLTAEFVLCDEPDLGGAILFSLRRLGHGVVVRDADGGPIGTFGDLGAAVEAGWLSGWRP